MRADVIDRALLYARTARHLRWEQWLYRPVRRVQRLLPVRGRDPGVARSARVARLAEAVAAWDADDEQAASAAVAAVDEVLAGRFRFLNRTEHLPAVDWSRRHVSHLWSYYLHYFDYAPDLARAWRATGDARYAERFVELARGWIAGNPSGRGDGWEPYPVSLRVANWIQALLLLGEAVEPRARAEIERSVAVQLAWLERRLELHILANHLQKNLKAMLVGGLYFAGPAADRWLERGARLLWRVLEEQVLPDGCQYERSPMYHAVALGDFLEVVSLLGAAGLPVPPAARRRVAAMVGAMGVLSRPDGSIHLFNDAARGIAPPRAALDRMAHATIGAGIPAPEGLLALPDAGYFGWAAPAVGERILVDCGIPGPAYQPGHAHCDLLSFELDLAGRPVIVDSGVSGYDGDPLREYVRSTRAHNTLTIDGREQSEVWGTFRLARRARPLPAEQSAGSEGYRFRGAYRPYHDRGARHERRIEAGRGVWRVVDRVAGAAGARLESFVHFHPDFELRADGATVEARAGDLTVRLESLGADEVSIHRGEREPAQGWYCPEFGLAVPAAVVRLVVERNDGRELGYTLTRI